MIANRRFLPSIFGTVLTVAGIALFVWLGFWQLRRADEKRALIAQYTSGALSVVELTAGNIGSLSQYQHVQVRGRYDPHHQILLDNMPSQHGQVGFRVATPFELEQGGWILVDRGWLPMGPTRAEVPDVSVDATPRTVTGRFDALPRAGIELRSPDIGASRPWPRLMSFPQQIDVERALGHPLIPGLILLDAAEPAGYERASEIHLNMGPERHLAYAVTWFAFAGAALVIYVIVSLRRDRTIQHASP